MKPKRQPLAQDLPSNSAELRALVIRSACARVGIPVAAFTTSLEAKCFAAIALKYAPAGDHPYCVHGELGTKRAGLILGKDVNAEDAELYARRKFATTFAAAVLLARKLTVQWTEQKGKAA